MDTNIHELEGLLEEAWSSETSSDPNRWSPANPALGQCAVTALVVQDLLGGELLRGEVGNVSHYWNILPSGQEVDLTIGQFGTTKPTIHNIGGRSRDYVLSFPATQVRYGILSERVRNLLGETANPPRVPAIRMPNDHAKHRALREARTKSPRAN